MYIFLNRLNKNPIKISVIVRLASDKMSILLKILFVAVSHYVIFVTAREKIPRRFNELNEESRIIGGKNASKTQFKYAASIRNGDFHFCGGSILTNRWVITSGFRLEGESASTTFVGDYALAGGVAYNVSKLVPHPKYVDDADLYDIGLIQT